MAPVTRSSRFRSALSSPPQHGARCRSQESTPVRDARLRSTSPPIGSFPSLCSGSTKTRSGVKVNAVYDTEETKSTGLANRLMAEKARPQADVFWSNEPVRTLVLKSRGVLAPYKSPSAQGIPPALVDPDGYLDGLFGPNPRHRLQHDPGPAGGRPAFGLRPGRSQVARTSGDRGPAIRLHVVPRRRPVRACRR